MRSKLIPTCGMLAVVLVVAPLVGLAQEGRRDGRRGVRGDILVTNDWENTVRVTLWKQHGEQMSRRSWTLAPGQSAILGDGAGRSIRVRADDKIKVGEDWGRVDIGSVGQWQGDMWIVNVRDIWRATHDRGSRAGLPPDPQETVVSPDPPGTPFLSEQPLGQWR